MGTHTQPVIPAKAGIQGAGMRAPALDPRFRGGNDKWLVVPDHFRSGTQSVSAPRASGTDAKPRTCAGIGVTPTWLGTPVYRPQILSPAGVKKSSPCGQIRELAACPNVHVKLGGLGMRMFGFTHHLGELPPSSQELAAAWRPYIETCIAAFGPERAMFESNFPSARAAAAIACYGTPSSASPLAAPPPRKRRCSRAPRRILPAGIENPLSVLYRPWAQLLRGAERGPEDEGL
jgi:Amidohydrolase